jgi:hypothetical protein
MNLLANEWTIQSRANACAVTGRPFASGEYFYTTCFAMAKDFAVRT